MTDMEWYAFVVGTALLACLGVLVWKFIYHLTRFSPRPSQPHVIGGTQQNMRKIGGGT